MSTLVFGAGLIGFAYTRQLWLSLIILPLVGAGFMVQMASTNTILQTIVEPGLRGCVMSFYTMAFLGAAPIGSLVAVAVADRPGVQHTIALGGVAYLAGAAWFGITLPKLRVAVRPVYIERGIISSGSADVAQTEGSSHHERFVM